MILWAETDMDNQNIFCCKSKSLGKTTDLNLLSDYILVYNLKTQSQTEIRLPIEDERCKITGIKYHE